MAVDTIEGVLEHSLHYHYDVAGDVLYLRLEKAVGEPVYGVEDGNGYHALYALADNRLVGLTIIGFWRQFGDASTDLTKAADWEATLEQSVSRLGEPLLAG